jgi:hypothetical protein
MQFFGFKGFLGLSIKQLKTLSISMVKNDLALSAPLRFKSFDFLRQAGDKA